MGGMKSIIFPRNCARFYPETPQANTPQYRKCKKAPGDSICRPSADKNEIVSERPKCDERYRQQQNIACMGLITSSGDPAGFRPGILCNWACLYPFGKISADSHSFSPARADKSRAAQAKNTEQVPRHQHNPWRFAAQKTTQ